MGYKDEYNKWLQSSFFSEEIKEELRRIEGDEKEIEDRFCQNLKFGTGGLRGLIGAGTNRMNVYTVSLATQGLADYIVSMGREKMDQGVVIAYDSRKMSYDFSVTTALCLNANGIKTYCFDSVRPTPELSFAVRELGCVAGVMITASHNPKEYNGYKVYWEDGGQITPPHDKRIFEKISKVESFSQIRMMKLEDAKTTRLFNYVQSIVDERYYEAVLEQMIHRDIISMDAGEMKIVYTPLHGTGGVPVRELLNRIGFKKVFPVCEQEQPNGAFPTVKVPNPEKKEAFALALKQAKKINADVVIATDPDADRIGVYIKDSNGVFAGTHFADTMEYPYVCFTGNMNGIILEDYICREKSIAKTLPRNGVICSTIVSTNLGKKIAEKYNMEYIETLTGFKYIGEQIKIIKTENAREFVYGFEESCGCLSGDYTRDKDACLAAVLVCEAAAYSRMNHETLCDVLFRIYQEHGFFLEGGCSLAMEGLDGIHKINLIMDSVRKDPIKVIAGRKVLAIRDYLTGIRINMETKEISPIDLPKSDVMYYELDYDFWVAIRPSGTEPKLKLYCGVKSSDPDSSKKALDEILTVLKNALIKETASV